jgi:hypothetical protein
MAVNYNPKVTINGLIHYFDSKNSRSYSNNIWSSLVSSISTNTSASFSNGFLSQDSILTASIPIESVSQINSVTVVSIFSSNMSSKGTVFSIYGDQNYFYNATELSSVSNTHTTFPDATGTANVGLNFVNTALAFVSNTHTTFPDATGTANVGLNQIITAIIENITHSSNTFSLSTDYYADSPTSDISFYIENDSLNGLYRSNGFIQLLTSNFTPSDIMDCVTVVYKNNTYTDSGIKLYLNSVQISNSSNSALLGSFGNTLSLLSRNAQLSVANFPVRTVMIYNRELTDAEIRQNYNALNGIKG